MMNRKAIRHTCLVALLCVPYAYALVETDNPLLGVLKREGYTVIQEIGYVHIQQPGKPSIQIRDSESNTHFNAISNITTLPLREHKGVLNQFSRNFSRNNPDYSCTVSDNGTYVTLRWQIQTTRNEAIYQGQLQSATLTIEGIRKSLIELQDVTFSLIDRPAGTERIIYPVGTPPVELVWAPAGSFIMGSPNTEQFHKGDENQREVTLSSGFWISKYEVSQLLWKSVMGDNPAIHQRRFISPFISGELRPVENVSWYDCQIFIQQLNGKTTNGFFRFPTEAEWEYACRAGTTGARHFTGSFYALKKYAFFKDHGNKTGHIMDMEPNPWGIYNMYGNVWEWCDDKVNQQPTSSKPATNPNGCPNGPLRVVRGGSWRSSYDYCRSAARYLLAPDYRSDAIGLRLFYND